MVLCESLLRISTELFIRMWFSMYHSELCCHYSEPSNVPYLEQKQERRLKCRNTLGGLEISIQHQIVNALELTHHPLPPHPTPRKILQSSNQPGGVKKKSHCDTVALWKQSSDLQTGSIPLRCHWKPNCQVCHLWLFCWYRSFAMCIRTDIHASVTFPVLLPIDIENPHHYWNVVYR